MRGRAVLLDAALVFVAHALVCLLARLAGFDHVSDDDFARVTIAEAFAKTPKLDPSGTSWLPLPFWLSGTGLALFGRSLAVARILAVGFASLGASGVYLSLRSAEVDRRPALLGVLFAYLSPWAIWSGAATVPESLTASLLAIGLLLVPTKRAALGGLALAGACLSRYEPWPAAAIAAGALAAALRSGSERRSRRSLVIALALAIVGPLAWMAWNAHAHDGPLHFFRRVSQFKRAIGEGSTDTLAALAAYPWLLVRARPEVGVVALALGRLAWRAPRLRERWQVPLAGCLGIVLFLAYGNARDGAPAHHPERALLGPFVLLALFVADAGATWAGAGGTTRGRLAAAAVAILWMASFALDLREVPGTRPDEDRRPQIALGSGLRQVRPEGPITLTPCAYEHFALIAAHGAPEAFTTTTRAESATCPAIDLGP